MFQQYKSKKEEKTPPKPPQQEVKEKTVPGKEKNISVSSAGGRRAVNVGW